MMRRGLSIAGGGYKGLMTAEFLRLLEEDIGPLSERFDVVSGTSVGSLIAIGVSLGTPMKSIVELMLGGGDYIFPPEVIPGAGAYKRALTPGKHNPARLREIIESITADAKLADCSVPLIVSAVDLTSARAKLFKSSTIGGTKRDDQLALVDLAMASAAAPTFFPPHKIGPKYYCDGGLFANAPDLPNAITLKNLCKTPTDVARLLCVGTPDEDHAMASSQKTAAIKGVDWAKLSDPMLLNQMMAAQMTFTKQCTNEMLGSDCVASISPIASKRQSEVIGLDSVGGDAVETLFSIAHDAYDEFVEKRAAFLSDLGR